MPAPPIRLGVDFGTSNTVAVVRWPDGRARPLLFDGSPLLPSAVYAERDGGLVVGRDAVHSARLDPSRFEPNPKRRIDDGTVLLGDLEVPVGDLITAVLARVAEEWHRTTGAGAAGAGSNGNGNGPGRAPVEITLTCPATWGATRRLVLADAARAAGLGDIRMVVEPVAAATYFTQVLGRDVPIGSVVVVHDFGAGTFDASVVARTSSGFEVLAVDGCDDIGGLDVDEAVVKHIGTVCGDRDPDAWQRLITPETVEDRRARRLLWDDARVAKERLSRSASADLTVPLVGVDAHLTRDELERLAQPLIEATVRVTKGVMRWARIADGRLAGIFLVGGSSRIPLVATQLHRAIGEAPVAIEQPELVVAEGSVLAGAVAVPVAAAPAPGPATGEQPRIPASWASAPVPAGVDQPTMRVPQTAAEGQGQGRWQAGGNGGSGSSAAGPTAPVSPAAGTTRRGSGPPGSAMSAVTTPLPLATPLVAQPLAQPVAQPLGSVARPQPGSRPGPASEPVSGGAVYSSSRQSMVAADEDDEAAEPRRPNLFVRFLRIVFLTFLLVAVPLASAYAAYRITLHYGR